MIMIMNVVIIIIMIIIIISMHYMSWHRHCSITITSSLHYSALLT